jgi:hypothetical protein
MVAIVTSGEQPCSLPSSPAAPANVYSISSLLSKMVVLPLLDSTATYAFVQVEPV